MILFLMVIFNQNCATLISRNIYPFTIETIPENATIIVKNRRGKEVYKGTSPATIALRSGAGYFQKASYVVTISSEGYQDWSFPIKSTLDAWYAGNLLFSGLFGFLIVDPATGAMYKLKGDFVRVKLEQSEKLSNPNELKIFRLNDIPEEWAKNLIPLNHK